MKFDNVRNIPVALKIVDYLMSVIMGVGTLLLVTIIVDMHWNMFLAMIAGMMLGVPVLMITFIIFSSVSSPFEIFPAGMVITMITGMVTGMVESMKDDNLKVMLIVVIVFSLIVQLSIDLYNLKLSGELPVAKQD